MQAQSGQPDAAPGTEALYSVALVGIPLGEALEHLIDETRLDLAYASARVEGRMTYCRTTRATPEELLACVLRGTGLDYARLSSGTYVLLSDPREAPRYGRLVGQVVDAATGEPLPDASVLLASAAGTSARGGTSTNGAGRFALTALAPGPHRLVVTHVAYHDAADTVRVQPGEGGRVEIALRPRVVLSPPVVVSGFEARLPSEALGTGRRTEATRTEIAGVGREDIVQDLSAVAGVRLGSAFSDVHVQGGDAGEQQFFLDGAPVFMPVANGGFIGPFSPFAIQQVTVRKAGFGAERGSHLSGVIDVQHRLPAAAPLAASVQIDPLSADARLSGRVGRGERSASWMIAGRRGLWNLYQPGRLEALFRNWGTPDDFLLDALRTPGGDGGTSGAGDLALSGPLELGFSDLHAATRLRLGGLRSAEASFYRGDGRFGVEGGLTNSGLDGGTPTGEFEDEYRWTNYTGRLAYEWVPGARLFAQAEAWGSRYTLGHGFEPEPGAERAQTGSESSVTEGSVSEDFNRIGQAGGRLRWDYAHSDRHLLSGAVEAVYTRSDFSVALDPFSAGGALGAGALRPVAWRLAGFVEDEIALSGDLRLVPGLRLTYLPAQKTLFAEPRVAARYDQSLGTERSWAVRAAVGLYRQYLSSYDAATTGVAALLPRVRFWLPVGAGQRPPEAYHATVAALVRPNAAWELSAETYYKHQPTLWTLNYARSAAVDAAGSTNAAGGTAGGGLLAQAEGYAYGLAFTAERRGERLQAEAQYEYAIARRRVAGRFGGAYEPVPWSAPHRLRLSLDVAATERLTATVRWQGLFGRSWGFRQAYYDLLEPAAPTRRFGPFDLSDPAAHRLPAFSQWDLGLAYTREVGGLEVQGRVALLNALGRKNVTDWSLRSGGRANGETAETYERVSRRSVPRLPSLSLSVEW